MRKFWTRFKAGLEWIVEKGTKMYAVYDAAKLAVKGIKKAIQYVAPKISSAIKSTAAKVCTYVKATGLSSSITSPICVLQSANFYWVAAVGMVALGALVIYGIGTAVS